MLVQLLLIAHSGLPARVSSLKHYGIKSQLHRISTMCEYSQEYLYACTPPPPQMGSMKNQNDVKAVAIIIMYNSLSLLQGLPRGSHQQRKV